MLKCDAAQSRSLKCVCVEAELCIVGGGLAGVCCVITAARAGVKVALIHDRPVLGGNASSEVRLWVLGATSHMGNNNRWAREGGVIDELLVENLYRNREGNPLVFDTVLLEKVRQEPNITLMLNTAVFEVSKADPATIESVRAFCSQNSTMYTVRAPLFCDASGDGIVGFLAGAAFRMGAESRDEFGEALAPPTAQPDLLGHSLFFYSKDVGRPVRFEPPSFALTDIKAIPRWRQFSARQQGCQLWWIEFGGKFDTVHDTETIKWELWKIVYGVWNHIKNSGEFPEAETLTLEWVGTIPGKRESRRFEGDYILRQQDIVEQRRHFDAVSYGGWAIDLHPSEGVYSGQSGCTQWHSKGVYQIPYRCLYSRNIDNLFLAGRTISASHVAFGSTRVMATCAHNAQAVAIAAQICSRDRLLPRELAEPERIQTLQAKLLQTGQHIPHVAVSDVDDLARFAEIEASSELRLDCLPPSEDSVELDRGRGMLIPLAAGAIPRMSLSVAATRPTRLIAELRSSTREGNFTPDRVLERLTVDVAPPIAAPLAGRSATSHSAISKPHIARSKAASPLAVANLSGGGRSSAANGESHSNQLPNDRASSRSPANNWDDSVAADADGEPVDAEVYQPVQLDFQTKLDRDQYVILCLLPNPDIHLALSDRRVTGIMSLSHRAHRSVSTSATQVPPPGVGIDEFELWLPERRPGGQNLAIALDPPLACFIASNLLSEPERPTTSPNAWVASPDDPAPTIRLRWPRPQRIDTLVVAVDSDSDNALESVLICHPDATSPFCITGFRAFDGSGREIARVTNNHQTRCRVQFRPVETDEIRIEFDPPFDRQIPAAAFRIRAYGRRQG